MSTRFINLGAFLLAGLLVAVIPRAHALNVDKYPALQSLIDEMAEQYGYAPQKLRKTFRCVRIRPEIIEAMERPKEMLPWYEYSKIFLTEENVQRGARFWKKHAAALTRAGEEYGVPPETVVAIIGVETQFGRNKGNIPILDALTTLTLDYPARAAFFRRELTEFLLLARELDVDACGIKGSYAGAMGLPQFMPSNYRRFAVDFDANGTRDILDYPEDAIGSVAVYLKQHGWEAGAPVADDANLEGTRYFWIEKLGIKPTLPLRQLASYGIFPRRYENAERRAALISLEGEYGPFYRLGYNNFYVITRYNHNKRYAMAVYELGERIRQHMEPKPSP
jgi:membrane-bound lytic murein transglycosylase B